MTKEEAAELLTFDNEGCVTGETLEKTGAKCIDLFFEHNGRLWQVKSHYEVKELSAGEEMVDRMSKDHRFQTPSSRVAFDLSETESGTFDMYIRYTEINLKRSYIHHKLAEAETLRAAEEKRRLDKSMEEMEEEDYIPTGPMMF